MISSIIHAFVERKRATILLLVAILFIGFNIYRSIPKESFPDVQIPIIYVNVVLNGISTEDAVSLILKPLENKLVGINGVKEISGYAREGGASLILEFEANFDVKSAKQTVRNKVDEAEPDLPTEADKPTVNEINLSLLPVLSIILTGDIPERTLFKIAKEMRDEIEGINQVLEVELFGDKEEVLEIIVDPKVLEGYRIPVNSMRAAIEGNNTLIAAGTLYNKYLEYKIKIRSLLKNFFELQKYPIKANNTDIVKFEDLADVRRTFKEAKTVARIDNKSAVVLEIKKRTGENIIDTVNAVQKAINEKLSILPENLEIIYANDDSERIHEMISDLENNIIIGVLLVMFVIIKSVGARAAILIAISIPTSFLAGILILSLQDVTLNIVVLFSLILTVGMVVDDAIVIGEYADRAILEKRKVNEAYPHAAIRMFWPVFSSTLVKIIVFLPLLHWPGVLGKFMLFMPKTVIATLSSSFIYAVIFLPTLGILLNYIMPYKAVKKEEKNLDNYYIVKQYKILLAKVLAYPKSFIGIIFGVIVGSIITFKFIGPGLEFFPNIEPEKAIISVQSAGNSSMKRNEEIMFKVENIIAKYKSEISVYYTVIGQSNGNNLPKDTIGFVNLEFANWNIRRKAEYIIDDIENDLKKMKGITFQTAEDKPGPKGNKPVEIDFSGYKLSDISNYVDKVIMAMESIGGFSEIETNRSSNKIEWELSINKQLAARHGITVAEVGSYVQMLTEGFFVTKYRPDDVNEELDVKVLFPQKKRTLEEMMNLKIVKDGKLIPISNFAELKPKLAKDEIKRVARRNTITLLADVSKGLLVDNQLKLLANWLEENPPQDGIRVKYKGEAEDKQEAQDFLSNAFAISLLLMFIIMLVQFNNIYHTVIIMSAVFLSTGGVLIGLLLTYQPFGIVMSGVGVIALGGIVLNNNIIFIDTYQRLRKEFPLKEAIMGAGVQRLRPILLTAVTAILGLLPMILGLTINIMDRSIAYDAPSSQWWRQLSTTIAGGLAFATILTLFFTPALLMLEKDDKNQSK